MGSCASVQKSLGFPKRLFPASPTKEKPVNGKEQLGAGGFDLQAKPVEGETGFASKSPEFGSKDEMFFDSRAWLDSDCEDDFFSVNGDFTPSRGSTPNYQPRTPGTTTMSGIFLPETFPDSKSEPSPTGRKKLAELLQDTSQSGNLTNEKNGAKERTNANAETNDNNSEQRLKSVTGTPHKQVSEGSSACSREATPSRYAKNRKEKMWNTAGCCFPGFTHTLGFDDRRQKMSPGPCAA